jgi:replicative DNA helicase
VLHSLYALPVVAGNATHYARQVRAAARRRQLVAIGSRVRQIGEDVADLDEALTAAAKESLSLSLLIDETDGVPVENVTWDAFLSVPDRSEDWIVPGLLERMNLVMMLARPGAGKSWLSRQVCLSVAAGIHPFKPGERIEPQRTLLVDLENTPSMVRKQTRPLASQ